MTPGDAQDITVWLSAWREGDEEAGRKLIAAVYSELRRVAAGYLRREWDADTLQPTALVNELCVGMLSRPPLSCENRLHFLRLAAQQIRRLLVDYARKRKGERRGGGCAHVPLDEARDHAVPLDERLEAIHEALERLEELDGRAASVVEMRFFGGLTELEIAEVLGVSVATVKRDWDVARSWVIAQMK